MRINKYGKFEITAVALSLAILALVFILQVIWPRPMLLDECALGHNVQVRGFLGLLKPLDMNQVAPIGLLFLNRASALALDFSDFSMRLPSMVAWLAIWYLLYRLLSRDGASAIAIFLTFFLFKGIHRYGFEMKQYIFDALGLAYLYYISWGRSRSAAVSLTDWRNMVPLLLLSWCSHITLLMWPMLVGLTLLYEWQWTKRNLFPRSLVSLLVPAITLGLIYLLFIHGHPNRDKMDGYWEKYFLRMDSSFFEFIWRNIKRFVSFQIISIPVDLPEDLEEGIESAGQSFQRFRYFSMANLFFKMAFVSAMVYLGIREIRENGYKLLLIVSPFILGLLLSAFHFYPFDGERLTLYLGIPCIVLIVLALDRLVNSFRSLRLPLSVMCVASGVLLLFTVVRDDILNPLLNVRAVFESTASEETLILHRKSTEKFQKYYWEQARLQGRTMPKHVFFNSGSRDELAQIFSGIQGDCSLMATKGFLKLQSSISNGKDLDAFFKAYNLPRKVESFTSVREVQLAKVADAR